MKILLSTTCTSEEPEVKNLQSPIATQRQTHTLKHRHHHTHQHYHTHHPVAMAAVSTADIDVSLQEPDAGLFTCEAKHALKAFVTTRAAFKCRSCGESQGIGAGMLGCRECDHDVCKKCVLGSSKSAGPFCGLQHLVDCPLCATRPTVRATVNPALERSQRPTQPRTQAPAKPPPLSGWPLSC